jgi:hypothetical protein
MRNDALNFDAVSLEHGQKFFLTGSTGDLFENVFGFDRHNTPALGRPSVH